MTRRIRAFLAFWYRFVIGDDWRVAVGVVVALALTFVVSTTSLPAWWILPTAVAMLLLISIWRVSRRTGH